VIFIEHILSFAILGLVIADIIIRVYQLNQPKSHLDFLRRELYRINVLEVFIDELRNGLGENSKAADILEKFADRDYKKHLKESIKDGDKTMLKKKSSDISKDELEIIEKAFEILSKFKK
jgi:hypothetical protein